MTEFKPLIANPPLDDGPARDLLARVIELAEATPDTSIVVFDLDSTLLDNSPRQAAIMREYGKEHGIESLASVQADDWRGWDARIPMRAAGLSSDEIEQHFLPFRDYWWHRFFVSDFCELDRPIRGAVEYTRSILETGGRIFYVTGRHEAMRPGTLSCFERHALPLPGERVELHMKPTLEEHDDAYKERIYEALKTAGRVIAAFDNEPIHINGYFEAFPDAVSVHLATDHSLRKVAVHADIPSIRDFAAWIE